MFVKWRSFIFCLINFNFLYEFLTGCETKKCNFFGYSQIFVINPKPELLSRQRGQEELKKKKSTSFIKIQSAIYCEHFSVLTMNNIFNLKYVINDWEMIEIVIWCIILSFFHVHTRINDKLQRIMDYSHIMYKCLIRLMFLLNTIIIHSFRILFLPQMTLSMFTWKHTFLRYYFLDIDFYIF